MERFREIQGTDGRYFVSDMGNVRGPSGNILKPFDRKGYLSVDFKVNGVVKYLTIHKLVATAFIGPTPEGMQVNHKNLNKYDNRAENLEYMTQHNNILHAWANGVFTRSGESGGGSKLKDEQVIEIRERHKTYKEVPYKFNARISREFGITAANVSCIVRGKSWKHLLSENVCQKN